MRRRGFRIVSLSLLLAVFIVVLFIPAGAQQYQYEDQGLAPYGSFNGGSTDSVNLLNGKLNLHIPLISYPQRGGKLHVGFFVAYPNGSKYTSKLCILNKCSTTTTYSNTGVEIRPDFVVLAGNTNGSQNPIYDVLTPNGTVHGMAPTADGILSLDATGYHYDDGSLVLTDRGGVRYFYNSGSLYTDYGDITGSEAMLTKVEDPNGNLIAADSTGWTDSLGRAIPNPPLASAGADPTSDYTGCTGPLPISAAYLWNMPGANGGTATFKICGADVQLESTYCNPACQISYRSEPMIQSIVLPNGTAWTFSYDSGSGNLSEITFPTGGSISYGWHEATYSACNAPSGYAFFSVISRSVDSNDGTGAHTWTYSGTTNGVSATGGSDVVTVTDPDGNQTVHTFNQPVSESCSYYETETQFYQDVGGAQTLLKTENTQYFGDPSPVTAALAVNVVPVKITTTWPNGQVNEVDKSYDSGTQITGTSLNAIYGLVAEEDDYDYGSGAHGSLLRRTDTTYEPFYNSAYLTNNLLTLPYSVTVYDGSGTQKAATVYGYDAASLASSGISMQHDSSPPDGPTRGNQTSVARWVSSSAGYLTTNNTFYDTGTLYQTKTPVGNTTTSYYSSAYAGAYPTQVTDPLGHSTSYAYDFNSGQLTSRTGPNGNTTTYTYDSMWRRHTVSYPDTSSITYTYSETSTPFTETITDEAKVTTITFDGLGRRMEQQVERPSGGCSPITTQWTYDVLGNLASVTNPYCSTGDQTYGVTSYTYDALHRRLSTTNPDGSVANDTYVGAATEVQDEGNGTSRVERVYQDDGLGRLDAVCEVTSVQQMGTSGSPAACGLSISATGFLTTYSHDALGNLTAVYQSGLQTRSFQYDGLSRLTSSTNPETGTIAYTYDGDSNVSTRTDARSITTTYTYDAVDRVLTKTYSDGTPEAVYTYDTNSEWGVTLSNTVGRLVAANGGGAGTIFSYDSMGRVINEWECTPVNCGTGSFPLAYTYDLLGDLTSETNGEGVTISYSYDSVGELAGATSSLQDSTHPGTLLSNVQRNATGQVISDQLGNGIQETYNYDDRAHLTSETAGSAYSVSIGYAADGDVTSANDSVNGDWTFTYDDFDRLATSNKNSGQLSYNYAYDRYGNMWHGDGGLSVSFSGGNNRVDGYSYDASGNLLNDGTHSYTYDAEDRITQVDGGSTATYAYDALGHRIRKTVGGVNTDFVYDVAGHAVAEVGGGCGTNCWFRGEVFAGGRHLATYANSTAYFIHADWLGTERARTDANGSVYETCQSLPYGDGLSCSGGDVSPLHFTGKMRDTESNLDDFGARYYTSAMGRWMTPDWSARGEAVPYAVLTNPQSLNLYDYVLDNPATGVDPDGHLNGPGDNETPGSGCGATNQPACQPSSAQVAANQTNNPEAQQANGQKQVSGAYHAACSNSAQGCSAGQQVIVRQVGGIPNVQIPHDPISPQTKKKGIPELSMFRRMFHPRASGSYFMTSHSGLFGRNVSHVVDRPGGVEAHIDPYGPLNPLHLISAFRALFSGAGPPVHEVCSPAGGCQ